MLRRHVEFVDCEALAIQRVHVLSILRWKEAVRVERILAECEAVDLVRDVREGQIQRPLGCVLCLEVHGAGDARHLDVAPYPAAFGEDLVVPRTCVHVPLLHLVVGERDQRVNGSLSVEVHVLPLLHPAPVQPDCREGPYFLLLARLLEIDAIDLQHSNVSLNSVGINHVVLAAVELVLEFPPRGREVPTVRAPVGVEVHEGEIVRVNHRLEVVVLELVARGAPVSIEFRESLLGETLVGILELHKLVLGVRVSLISPLVVDALLHNVPSDVHPLRPKRIPDAHGHVVTGHVKHGDIEVNTQQRVLVAVQHNVCARLRSQERGHLAEEQDGAGDHRDQRHQRS
mmetsp:Transcript_70543/g.199133  ORF Transcript_70543/g.199133 Transcript_70543/m.199133 type:complete len:343 (+) Transcript_70543:393-1421(+)